MRSFEGRRTSLERVSQYDDSDGSETEYDVVGGMVGSVKLRSW